ncbi:hypothetical protein HDV05_001467 [Chytridiales sp. JEL 0842]|nr:hypothetical protein HDV05_001467 [Chytridiales sp. JEL 0842]
MLIVTCILAAKWKGTPLAAAFEALPKELQMKLIFDDTLDCDCRPYAGLGISYLPETLTSLKPIKDYHDTFSMLQMKGSGLVIVERSGPKSGAPFSAIQTTAVLNYGLQVLPVRSPDEAARYIARLAYQEARPAKHNNLVAAASGKSKNLDALMIKSLSSVPGIGDAKALELLKHFGSLRNIANLTDEEIMHSLPSIGRGAAKQVHAFFAAPLNTAGL